MSSVSSLGCGDLHQHRQHQCVLEDGSLKDHEHQLLRVVHLRLARIIEHCDGHGHQEPACVLDETAIWSSGQRAGNGTMFYPVPLFELQRLDHGYSNH
ncbi:hypothetical protein RRG08_027212 [Elysia crispata]|uniref:Uncharacterized protein n=1 Tax=Elysia crispata TaxID=231223 RepID=A0AAE1DUI0_9GAST|nr:hypothetical protein RRG08_027212 [Elysia crispata]